MTYSTSIDDISNQSANLWPYRQSSPSEQALLKQPWTCTVDGLLSPDEQTHSRPQGPIHTTDLKHTPGDQSIAPNPPNEQLNTNEREEQPPMTENRLVPIAHVVYRPYDDPVDTEHKTRKAITKAKLMRIIDDLFLRTILNVIFGSMWWRLDEIEPEAAYNSLIESCGDIHKCRICNHEKTRWDRALAHIRKHVEHRPFVCFGRSCSNGRKCTSRFFTKECLSAHQKSNTVVCHCGAEVIPKNLSRHQRSLKCREAQTAPQPTETVVD